MNKQVQYTLDMAARVRSFSRTNASSQPEHTKVLGELEDRLTRAETVAKLRESGALAAREARDRRLELRKLVHTGLLRYLVAVGGAAAHGKAELVRQFRLPNISASHRAFVTFVQTLLDKAEGERELLVEKGMSAGLLDDIRAGLAGMESAMEASRQARIDRTAARVELDEQVSALHRLVRVLDGLNQVRFRGNPELLEAWNGARQMPPRRHGAGAPDQPAGEGVKPPGDGGIAPAA